MSIYVIYVNTMSNLQIVGGLKKLSSNNYDLANNSSNALHPHPSTYAAQLSNSTRPPGYRAAQSGDFVQNPNMIFRFLSFSPSFSICSSKSCSLQNLYHYIVIVVVWVSFVHFKFSSSVQEFWIPSL